MVAFRGTEKTVADWMINFQPNLDNLTALYPTATGRVHRGFLDEYKISRDAMVLALNRLLGNVESQVSLLHPNSRYHHVSISPSPSPSPSLPLGR